MWELGPVKILIKAPLSFVKNTSKIPQQSKSRLKDEYENQK